MRGALEEVQRMLPEDATVFAYLDDIYVLCAHGDAFVCYDIIRNVLHRGRAININMGKLAAWSLGRQDPPPYVAELGERVWRGNLLETEQGIKVFGSPVGTAAFVAECGPRGGPQRGAAIRTQS